MYPWWVALNRSGFIAASFFTAWRSRRWSFPTANRNARLRSCARLRVACHHAIYRYTWMDALLLYDIEHKKK
jgi:hypothetical protein